MPNPDDVQLATNEARSLAREIYHSDGSVSVGLKDVLYKLANAVDLLAARVAVLEAQRPR